MSLLRVFIAAGVALGGFLLSKPIGYWVQNAVIRDGGMVDERAALIAAGVSSSLVALSLLPLAYLFFGPTSKQKADRAQSETARVPSLASATNTPSKSVSAEAVRDFKQASRTERNTATVQTKRLEAPALDANTAQLLPANATGIGESTPFDEHHPPPPKVSLTADLMNADAGEEIKQTMRDNGFGEKARIAIEYDPSAALAWGRVQALPERYRGAFLSQLDANPSGDSTELAIVLEAEYQRELRPFDSDDANDAYEQAGTISVDAQSEFRKVYQLLRSTVSASEILSKIEHRFGPSEITKQRETARIEAERAAAEEDRLQRMEAYSAAMVRERAARSEARRAAAARCASEQIEQARMNAEIQAAEKIEIIAKALAMQEAKRRIAADRARQFRHGLALIGRYQLHALMVSLLALLYFALAFA